VSFGHGALDELGGTARALDLRRVALFTDRTLRELPSVHRAIASLRQAGLDFALYDDVAIEPTERSFLDAAAFLQGSSCDGIVSVGGGSTIDTAKAASLYATYPAAFRTYVNAPLGDGAAVPGPLRPHLACPTTAGTGSECTGIAICTLGSGVKSGLVSRQLRPTVALIDPATSYTLPAGVVAASGCDVLCHALESYTARPYNQRPRLEPTDRRPTQRPLSQGANPYSDLGCLEALRLCGRYLRRAIASADDHEARDGMMWAATLAGIAFGNAGVHLPHAMAYAIASQPHGFRLAGYPAPSDGKSDTDKGLIPHGLAVILAAPAAFRFTASACADRHLEAAIALGVDCRGAVAADAGRLLSAHLVTLLAEAALPRGLAPLGYQEADIPLLSAPTWAQSRLLQNAPRSVDQAALAALFGDALHY
jgi:alcohol dehydrogenase class IV